MHKKAASLLAVIAILLTTIPAFAVGSDPTARGSAKTGRNAGSNIYIVQLSGPPAAAYEGGVAGIRATAPRAGERLDASSPEVVAYSAHLVQRQADVLAGVATADRIVYNYTLVFNGFAARLTGAEAAALRAQPGVVNVFRDTIRQLDTLTTPQFLGLQNADGTPAGLWAEGIFGENVVVGVLDSGIWPENPSFSDRLDVHGVVTDEPTYNRYRPFRGACVPGEAFEVSDCNNKLLGARWYNAGWGGDTGVKDLFPYEYASARDADGHGTHTTSTAAGNRNVEAVVDGNLLGLISGMAPRARIATYKVCWGRGGEGGCAASDSVAAIDQAVADRVDVLNFSVGPGSAPTNFSGPEEIAVLFAARAGVFTATSAGNAGPGASTVGKNSPWTTTVAAGTHTRTFDAGVTLGDGSEYAGQSASTTGAGPAPLVLSTAAGLAGANANEVRLCFLGVLDPAVVTGKIVLCDRGVNARTEKSQAVRDAGGVGMILANTSPNSINADLHFVPTIHVDEVAGAAIKAYAAAAGASATAQISPGVQNSNAPAPFVAAFSSRGPIVSGGGDFLQPDILAPGVDVLAAVSPDGYAGRSWDFLSGTSMASPHVAGLAALVVQKRPSWSPGMIKSALMTTASQTQVNAPAGTPIPGTPFDFGAGFVNVNAAVDPGLVYNARWNHWLTFLCGVEPGLVAEDTCTALDALGYSTEPTNHNTPSIAIGALAGLQTIRRTVTNVGSHRATYHVQVEAPPGFEIRVRPEEFTLEPGQRKRFTMRFTNVGAALNEYVFGSLTWTDGEHNVRIPIVVQPVAVGAPGAFVGTGATGTATLDVGFGYTGPYSPTVSGLVAAQETAGTVLQDPDQTFDPADPAGTFSTTVTVPAGVLLARFQLFDEYTDGDDDLDLYVFDSAGNLVASSGSPTAAEVVTLEEPAADTYTVFVHGWLTDGPDANFTLFTWVVPPADAGNLTVSGPPTVAVGETHPVTLSWNVAAGAKYLGLIHHNDAGTPPATTEVFIDADAQATPQGGMELTPNPEPEAPAEGEEGQASSIYLPFVGN